MAFLINALKYILVDILAASFKSFFDTAVKIVTITPIIAGYIALILAVTAAYLLACNAVLSGLNYTIPQVVLNVWGWVMPSNAIPCLIALYTVKISAWAYKQFRSVLDFKANAVVQAAVQNQKR